MENLHALHGFKKISCQSARLPVYCCQIAYGGCLMEKILIFQSPHVSEIKRAASALRLKAEAVAPIYFKETLGEICRGRALCGEEYAGELPDKSLLLFCDVQEKKMDKILAILRKRGIPIDYKAILTPTNSRWNVLRLYFEMEREERAWSSLQ